MLALDHHQGEVEFGLDPADDADDDQPALVGEGVHVGGQVLGPDVVENEVDPFLAREFFDQIGKVGILPEIDDEIGAELADPLHLLRGCGDDQLRIGGQGPAELNAGGVHSPAAAVKDGRAAVLEVPRG